MPLVIAPGSTGTPPPGFAFVPPNHHAILLLASGGFQSGDGMVSTMLSTQGVNTARYYAREGYEFIGISHANTLIPQTKDPLVDRKPAFLPTDVWNGQDHGIFAQVHHAVRHIRANRPHLEHIGARGDSSGGALAANLLLAGGLGPDPLNDPVDAETSKVDAARVGATALDLLNWRYQNDHAFFWQIPEYFVHPDLTGVPNPYDREYDPNDPDVIIAEWNYPAPPSDPLQAVLYDGGSNYGLGVHAAFHPDSNQYTPYPGPFPAFNWKPGTSGFPADTPGELVDPETGIDSAGNYVGWDVTYDQITPPASAMMGMMSIVNDSSCPLLWTHGTEDGQIPYHQLETFVGFANGLTSFRDRFRPVGVSGGNHGGRDSDHERELIDLAWFRLHLESRDDLDSDGLPRDKEAGDPTANPAIPATDPVDPDTDGDGMVDGAERKEDLSEYSDPLDPADGLRIIGLTRTGPSALLFVAQQAPGTYALQKATNLNKLSANELYEWEDVSFTNPIQNTIYFTDTLPALDPNGTNHAVFYRVRHETSDFDWISSDPVGVSAVEIRRDPSGPIRNYISASLVNREARGKISSVTIDQTAGTADIQLVKPLAFHLGESLSDIQGKPANEKYVAIIIRDLKCAPERAFDGTPPHVASDYVIPRHELSGAEGRWWEVVSSSGAQGSGGDTTVTVNLRPGGTPPGNPLLPGQFTIAIRRLSSLEDVLGAIGTTDSPFKSGDKIELYGPDGVIARNGAATLPWEVLEFTNGQWHAEGNPSATVNLADRLLMPDEAFGYVAAQSSNGHSMAVMVGWVPMGDINAYIPPVASGETDVTVVKNYPYPADCPEQVFETGPTGLGLVESGFNEDNACFIRFPWPDGDGPPNTGPGVNKVWGDDGLTTTMGETALVEGAASITRAITSNRYWIGPPDPVWTLQSTLPSVTLRTEDEFLKKLTSAETGGQSNDPSLSLPYFDGPVLPKGRGREFTRFNYELLIPQIPGGPSNEVLIEWKRRRPYSWRL